MIADRLGFGSHARRNVLQFAAASAVGLAMPGRTDSGTARALLPGSVTKCHVGREPCPALETSSQASQVFIRSP